MIDKIRGQIMDSVENAAKCIPQEHKGLVYYDFMADLSRKRSTKRYLEVGVQNGRLMSYIHAENAIGVDPLFEISFNVANFIKKVTLISVTSDCFFASPDLQSSLMGAPELSFLDGYHTFEFLLRDIIGAERISSDRSLIVLHDCLPLDDVMTIRYFEEWHLGGKSMSTSRPGWWTGDVWKIVPILQKYRPDLIVVYVDCPPTGLVCISNLSPSSSVLDDNYFRIIEEFTMLPNTETELRKMYDSIQMTSSNLIMRENDHTLFFRT